MFGDGPLSFREFATREPYPLCIVHDAVLDFLRGREDVVLCGAHAVNGYHEDPRLSQDVDILTRNARRLAEELQTYLQQQFPMKLGVRECKRGIGYSLRQVRSSDDRHLVDVRQVDILPPRRWIEGIQVLGPVELIKAKLLSMVGRWKTASAMTDKADLCILLLTFPDLKTEEGPVAERLRAAGASAEAWAAWKELVAEEIMPEDEDAGY